MEGGSEVKHLDGKGRDAGLTVYWYSRTLFEIRKGQMKCLVGYGRFLILQDLQKYKNLFWIFGGESWKS